MRKHGPVDTRADQLSKLGYETRDISLVVLLKWGIFLFAFVAFNSVLTLGVYYLFVRQEVRQDSPAEANALKRLPQDPYPLLQPKPVLDIKDYRVKEDSRVTSPAWADKPGGTLRVPINRAMEMVLQKGLPARPNGSAVPSAPAPGDYLAPLSGQPVRPEVPKQDSELPIESTMRDFQTRGPASAEPAPATTDTPSPPGPQQSAPAATP